MTLSIKTPTTIHAVPGVDLTNSGQAVHRIGHYAIIGRHGNVFKPRGRYWSRISPKLSSIDRADNRFGAEEREDALPCKRFRQKSDELVPQTIWVREVGDNREAKEEIKQLFERTNVRNTEAGSVSCATSFKLPPTPVTSSSIASSAPARPPPSPTKWDGDISASKWAIMP